MNIFRLKMAASCINLEISSSSSTSFQFPPSTSLEMLYFSFNEEQCTKEPQTGNTKETSSSSLVLESSTAAFEFTPSTSLGMLPPFMGEFSPPRASTPLPSPRPNDSNINYDSLYDAEWNIQHQLQGNSALESSLADAETSLLAWSVYAPDSSNPFETEDLDASISLSVDLHMARSIKRSADSMNASMSLAGLPDAKRYKCIALDASL